MIEKLVCILPVHLRPNNNIFYAHLRTGALPRPICRIEPSGEVYLHAEATIADVQTVLAQAPYNLDFEELKEVYVRERR